MSDEEVYEALQSLLGIAQDLKDSGLYSVDEICEEIRSRLD